MVKVKLCGIRRPCEIDWVQKGRPDYVGFVFAGTRRRVDDDTARQLRRRLDPGISAVGVFVDEPLEHIEALVEENCIQVVQLHGDETEAYIRELRRRTGVPVIKAFSVASREDIDRAERSCADYVLLDHGKGGTGTAFDWQLAQEMNRPYFLAGGLYPGNVAEAVRTLKPYAVDVSSGVERDGWKDKTLIDEFMAQVRKAAQQEELR